MSGIIKPLDLILVCRYQSHALTLQRVCVSCFWSATNGPGGTDLPHFWRRAKGPGRHISLANIVPRAYLAAPSSQISPGYEVEVWRQSRTLSLRSLVLAGSFTRSQATMSRALLFPGPKKPKSNPGQSSFFSNQWSTWVSLWILGFEKQSLPILSESKRKSLYFPTKLNYECWINRDACYFSGSSRNVKSRNVIKPRYLVWHKTVLIVYLKFIICRAFQLLVFREILLNAPRKYQKLQWIFTSRSSSRSQTWIKCIWYYHNTISYHKEPHTIIKHFLVGAALQWVNQTSNVSS